MKGKADAEYNGNNQADCKRKNRAAILPKSGGIGFSGFIKEKRCNKQHQKELRINVHFLNTGKYQCNNEPDDNLQHRNGDARKFVEY